MPDTPDLTSAIADLDDDYLRVQLLLAVRRAGNEEPRRAALWHALAGLLAAEQQSRGQSAQLTGGSGTGGAGSIQETLDSVREELRRDAAAIEAEYGDAAGEFPNPAGRAPFVDES
ncbi:MAG TPA: hypothetical protein VM242_14510 [Acidimicrobiales bacterium]|jgi:hypothetical protein|nr:hypothetical protein [Acidimicrobiales bacterium]